MALDAPSDPRKGSEVVCNRVGTDETLSGVSVYVLATVALSEFEGGSPRTLRGGQGTRQRGQMGTRRCDVGGGGLQPLIG